MKNITDGFKLNKDLFAEGWLDEEDFMGFNVRRKDTVREMVLMLKKSCLQNLNMK
jgi:hypothetical protein